MLNALLADPWPWYVAGPLIGLFVPILLLLDNRQFGVSSNLRHLCAVVWGGQVEYLRYDWKREGGWNLSFLAGVFAGGFVAAHYLGSVDVAITDSTRQALTAIGVHGFSGLAPAEIFSWANLLSVRGLVSLVGGGLLVGFGTAYAGGCTSGHAIAGLAAFELASLIAVVGFFAGGLLCTFFILPLIL